MYLLGLDIGSSYVKSCVLDIKSNTSLASAQFPKKEMEIKAPQMGWAEQDPNLWWEYALKAMADAIKMAKIKPGQIQGIGISYQMHGLVLVDKNMEVLRPSIIWCDSRAEKQGNMLSKDLGEKWCLEHLLNLPGNFTASKLLWVKQNEPQLYEQIFKVMLPGDYIALKLSGVATTTLSGLSEGMWFDFIEGALSKEISKASGLEKNMIPEVVPTFSNTVTLNKEASELTGMPVGTPISYRAGDQPNNALSLNVLNPGEMATTAGTSGVVYGVQKTASYDKKSRVNTFVHVNNQKKQPRFGVLLCVNGTGILNNWVRNTLLGERLSYEEMNTLAAQAPIGSQELRMYPFGNGAERLFCNENNGASLRGLMFNTHKLAYVLRATQEGIAFGLAYGIQIMKDMGVKASVVRAGESNMFLSPLFREAFVHATGLTVELYNTDGAQGAARGAGIGAGLYTMDNAFSGLKKIKTLEPQKRLLREYRDAYKYWEEGLK